MALNKLRWVALLCVPMAIGACGDDDGGSSGEDAGADDDTGNDDDVADDDTASDDDVSDDDTTSDDDVSDDDVADDDTTSDDDVSDDDVSDDDVSDDDVSDDDAGPGDDDVSDDDAGPGDDDVSDDDGGTPREVLDVGARVINMTPERFFPEGVAVDKNGNFYMGSMFYGSIYTATADMAEAVEFIPAGTEGLISVIGLYADDANDILWVCSSDAGNAELSGSGEVAIKAFGYDGEFIASYAWPEYSGDAVEGATVNGFCNDMTMDADGNLYATDSWYPRIVRLPAGGTELEEWVVSDVFPQDQWHLNGIDIDQSSNTMYVVENHPGALYEIPINADGSAGDVETVETSRDLLSPDGLKVLAPGLLVTAEGANDGGSVSLVWLDNGGEVEEVIAGFDQVATLALHQGSAWIIENQGDHFWGPDNNGPDADPPFRLVEVPLSVGAGGTNVEIAMERFFPEGSTVDADGNFYVGSMDLGSIVKVAAGTTDVETFIESDGDNELVSVLGLFADDDSNTLWVCSSDAGNAQLSGSAAVAIKAFELDTGAFVASYDWPAYSGSAIDGATVNGFCNDITVASDGTLYATDSWYPRIVTLPSNGNELEEWVVSDVFPQDQWHLNGIDVDESTDTLYVVENHPGALYAVEINPNGSAGDVTEITTSRPLLSPDGLKVVGDGLLAAAEGQPGGMVTIEITGDTGYVRRISTGLDGIATFAMQGGSAWLVENQGDHFWNPDGAGADANKPFRLVEVPMNLP